MSTLSFGNYLNVEVIAPKIMILYLKISAFMQNWRKKKS